MNEIKSQRKIIQVGNSLAVTIPANVAHKLKVDKGDMLDVAFRKNNQLDDEFEAGLDAAMAQYDDALEILNGGDQA
ncbi:hypothetical protein AYR62_07400 [Secundilactobacillus paracollinoides]|uniref:SpoVT-AbrB domain-containing protein n=1 Tax=Secundilactobacillus paracollinoides TaxID=240427 RepID=A0A1B2J1L5_9LACO|nr:AbrB/MazE/SpoVT family DNA-binding domain-containing protein [Secundilactobacillus paracollinoides]ANZ62242.1 hypothetical protein AYR61_13415 [Secundilactobacillus paracollinoides]ANZ63930.1 hypothetical protein AYR62_07400 [Secundilactobacillus paracollinoides]ANZ68191.1 hypothetical protein AYR63_14290 [Secundilactobacillus paracollinoides]